MRIILFLSGIFFLGACGSKDPEILLGKWYNENHWFEFHNEKEYSGGVGPIVNQDHQEYVLEPKENKLTFYTTNENETYYVRYEFLGNDTLAISNFMNNTTSAVKYVRKND